MSTNKHALIRYQALDKCFQNQSKMHFIDDLISACNEAIYEFTGNQEGIKRRQLFDDIKFMESDQGWAIPLERFKSGRKVYYRYIDPHFSINKQPINQAETEQLKEAILTLSHFKGSPQFEWIEQLSLRLESSLEESSQAVIEYEENPYLIGKDFITQLYQAIANKQAIRITYQGFKQENSETKVYHPYYLKQYNKRWYLIAKNADYDSIANLALDRIKAIEESSDDFVDSEIDFHEYFEDVIGVTINDAQPEKVLLEITESQWPYIRTKPIHGSQKTISENGSVKIEIEVIPNFELESQLLQYGEGIKVLHPQHLREKIKKRIQDSLSNY